MSNANSHQVGGNHYKCPFEHWDLVELNGVGYLEGCASKYVARWRKKGGVQDLQKALHYIDKTIELLEAGKKQPSLYRREPGAAFPVNEFANANGLDARELLAVQLICDWRYKIDLTAARNIVEGLIKDAVAVPRG